MRRRWQSLQLRLSVLFVALLLGAAALYAALLYGAADKFVAEQVQRRNRGLAASVAQTLRIDVRTNDVSQAALRRTFDAAMTINPRIKLYLVGLDGRLITASAKPHEVKLTRVPTAPIRAFLGERVPLPIWGTDPRHPAQASPFSAVLLRNRAGGPHCYLYITLDGHAATSDEPAAQRHSYILRVLLRALLAAGLGVALLGVLLISLLTRNLHRLAAAVRRLQAGDYGARVAGVGPGGEVGELAAAFNAMAARTQQAVAALESTDQLRRELIANVSHDLRTPLASIEGYAETILLKDADLSDAERRGHLRTILNNTRSLKRLVSELFELSKLEARQVVPRPEPFAVAELVQDLLLKLEPEAAARAVRLEAAHVPDLPLACADVGLVERVLQNLLENALRYTPPGGRVRVDVAPQADARRLRLEVCDTGRGIAPADLPHVFDRFYRAPPGRANAPGGLGLGLAIARKIVELHGSQLQVVSAVGEGTCFAFALPVYAAPPARIA